MDSLADIPLLIYDVRKEREAVGEDGDYVAVVYGRREIIRVYWVQKPAFECGGVSGKVEGMGS